MPVNAHIPLIYFEVCVLEQAGAARRIAKALPPLLIGTYPYVSQIHPLHLL